MPHVSIKGRSGAVVNALEGSPVFGQIPLADAAQEDPRGRLPCSGLTRYDAVWCHRLDGTGAHPGYRQ